MQQGRQLFDGSNGKAGLLRDKFPVEFLHMGGKFFKSTAMVGDKILVVPA